jgi:hypothetical protein
MCWHKWSKWKQYEEDIIRYDLRLTPVKAIQKNQKRHCLKCNKEQVERIY